MPLTSFSDDCIKSKVETGADTIPALRMRMMDNGLIITAAFPGASLLAYAVIPGLLVMSNRMLNLTESGGKPK